MKRIVMRTHVNLFLMTVAAVTGRPRPTGKWEKGSGGGLRDRWDAVLC